MRVPSGEKSFWCGYVPVANRPAAVPLAASMTWAAPAVVADTTIRCPSGEIAMWSAWMPSTLNRHSCARVTRSYATTSARLAREGRAPAIVPRASAAATVAASPPMLPSVTSSAVRRGRADMPAVLSGVPGYGSTFPSLGTTRGGAKVPTTNVPLPRCARRTTPAVTGAVRVRGGCGSVRWFGGHAGRPMGHGQTTAGEWGRGHGHLRYVGPGAAGGCLRCPGGVDRRGRRRGRHVDRGSAGRRGGRGAARRAVPDRTVRRRRRGQGRRERRARVPADRPGLVRGRVEGPAHRGERRPGAGPRDRQDRYPARRRGPGAVRAGGVQPGAGRGVHPVPDLPAGCA